MSTTVAVRGAGELTDRLVAGLAAAGITVTDGDRYDALVVVPQVAAASGPIESVTDDEFRAAWEEPLRTTVEAMIAARAAGATRLVVVTSTAGMTGAERGAPLAMSAEALRALVKSVARQWGREGITANTIAVDPGLLGVAAGAVSIAPRALGEPGDPAEELGPIVAFCCSPAAGHLTGATLTVDGGSWMP